jgi:HEAT repeat protein
MATHPAIAGLINALHDDRDGLRQFAVRRLVNMGPDVIPALIETLQDNKEYTQEAAAIALRTFGNQAVPHLLKAMKCDNRRIRWGAVWVLQSMGPEARKTVPAVIIPSQQSAAVSEVDAAKKIGSGVWSDAWLTKVRQQLNDARNMDMSFGAAQPEPG